VVNWHEIELFTAARYAPTRMFPFSLHSGHNNSRFLSISKGWTTVTGWFEHLEIPSAVIVGKSVQTYKRRPWMAPHWGSLALMIAVSTFHHQISHAFSQVIFCVFNRL